VAAGRHHACLDPLPTAPAQQLGTPAAGTSHGAQAVSLPASIFVGVVMGATVGGGFLGLCIGGYLLGPRQRSSSRRRSRRAMMPSMPWRVSRGYELQAPEPAAEPAAALRDADVLANTSAGILQDA